MCTARHPLPPVRGAPHRRVPEGLHLRATGRDEAAGGGRQGAAHLRDEHGAVRRARVPCRGAHPRPGRVDSPRGRRHRSEPHRRRVGRCHEAWLHRHCLKSVPTRSSWDSVMYHLEEKRLACTCEAQY
jgi:hypothetical protein